MRERVEAVYGIVDACKPHLGGHDQAVQGAALALMLAAWLVTHSPHEREELLQMHLDEVRRMVPAVLKVADA